MQFGTDPAKLPFTTGCTSIQVTDIIPYVENEQIRGILEGMPGAAEYEKLVEMKFERWKTNMYSQAKEYKQYGNKN